MSALARQQEAMLQAVFGRWDESALHGLALQDDSLRIRGLQAYRSHGHALAHRALAAAYPVISRMLGEENFEGLARAFWHRHPPESGDMAQWGGQLPGYVEQAAQLAGEPCLADVARVEWALHRAAAAADVVRDPGSFRLLVEHDPATVTLDMAAGTQVIRTAWPVVSLVNAHLTGIPDLEMAGERLRAGAAEIALVWRQGFRPMLRESAGAEAAFLEALHAGLALDAALDTAEGLDFNTWLAPAVQSGLLAGASLLSS